MAVRIAIEHLSKSFGTCRAVEDFSAAIQPGELFFLLGPSGCGKTTVLRAIAGFVSPDAGRICFDGCDVVPLPAYKRDTGMVFQNFALWPHMTVRENVAFGLEVRRLSGAEIRRRVDEALELVQLGARGEARPAQLSGGQQQRVALARALVVRPACLLLDEPLSNLDAKLRMEMRSEIRRVCKATGLTAIYVTHDQKEALSIADRIAVMDAGRLRQVGTPREIYRSPASRFVAGFIGETNLVEGTITDVAGGTVKVDTSLGALLAEPGAERRICLGARVWLSIRPEALRRGPAGGNRVTGRVVECEYFGDSAQARIELLGADGQSTGVSWKVLDHGADPCVEGQVAEWGISGDEIGVLEE